MPCNEFAQTSREQKLPTPMLTSTDVSFLHTGTWVSFGRETMVCSSLGKQDSHLLTKKKKHTSKSCRNTWLQSPCCHCNPTKQHHHGLDQPPTSCWRQNSFSGFPVLYGQEVRCCSWQHYLGSYTPPRPPHSPATCPRGWEPMPAE